MTDKRPSNARARRECFEANKQVDYAGAIYLVCHICGGEINPVYGWEADHVVPYALGGTLMKPAHTKCHREKTSITDVPAIAKTKRVSDSHFGIKKKGWGGQFRRKINGEVVPK